MKTIALVFLALSFSIIPALAQTDISDFGNKLYGLEKEGKYDEAVAEINEFIKIQPNNGELYLWRSKFLKLQNKLDEAIADISQGIAVEPDKPAFYLTRARYYNLQKDNEAVSRDMEMAASLPPKDVAINYGIRKLFQENTKLADFYISRNTADDDASSKIKFYAYKTRGENKFALKDYAGALDDSITAINFVRLKGDDNEYSNAQGALREMTNSEVIAQTTQNYLKDDKQIFDYCNRLFDALQSKTETVSEREVARFIKERNRIEPNKPVDISLIAIPQGVYLQELMLKCVQLYTEKNQIEQAEKLFKRLVELKVPNRWHYYDLRADFYLKLKNYQAAIDDLTFIVSDKEGLVTHPQMCIGYLLRRGKIYEVVNEFDNAAADYEMMKIFDPRNETAANAMILRVQQKQKENANQPK